MMINKELQDLVWSILPKEFKEEVKRCYQYALKYHKDDDMQRGALDTFEHLFGEHNLTSDAESEELPTIPRKKVQLLYKAFRDEEAELNRDNCRLSVSGLASVRAFDYFALFGEKCLPDKKPGPDLAKLKEMLDKSLASETKESLNAWLDEQEKKGYHITIDTFYPSYLNGSRDFKDNHYQCTVVKLNGGNRTEINYFPTYEEALKAGVEVALEKIIDN